MKFLGNTNLKLAVTSFITVIIILITGSYFWYLHRKETLITETYESIAAVNQLKADQIQNWRKERFDDANLILKNPFAKDVLIAYLAEPGQSRKEQITQWFNALVESYGYKSIYFLDETGSILIDSGERNIEEEKHISGYGKGNVFSDTVFISDIHYYNDNVHYTLSIPIKYGGRLVGHVLIIMDPENFLFPIIQVWPTHSKTAETFLVKKKGSEVIFLNRLMYEKNTVRKLTITAENENIPSVKAVKGITGFVKGIDYRGKEVIADIKKVEGTNWYIIAKIDEEEISGELQDIVIQTLVVLVFLIFGIYLFFLNSWRKQNIKNLRKNLELEKEKKYISEHLKFLNNHANDVIITTDKNYYIKYVNKHSEKVYGYSRDELIGMNIRELLAEEDESNFNIIMNKVKSTGADVLEIFHKRKDGTVFPVEVSISYLEIDEEEFTLGIVRDITERKKAEKLVAENERKLATLIKHLPGIAYRCKPDHNWTMEFISEGCVEVTGYEPSDLINNNKITYTELIHPDDRKYVDDTINECIAQGKNFTMLYRIIDKNKNIKWVWERGSGIVDADGQIIALEGFISDITERKRTEEELVTAKNKAEAADRLKSEFLAQMSHEIRTPVNVILSFTSFIRDAIEHPMDEDTQEGFEAIENASKRLIRTIDSLLNMSQIQLGSFDVNLQPVSVKEDIIFTLYQEFSSLAKAKGIKLEIVDNNPDALIYGDIYSVSQLFDNLIHNAIKYTEKGKISIIIDKNEQGKTVVKIADTGIGIKEEYIPQLFDAFSQEETGYSRKFEGTGLGLALVKNYCDLNKAEINVTSSKGKGTVFSVTFQKP